MAWDNPVPSRPPILRVFVVSTLDDAIVETFTTGVKDLAGVPVNEAKREIERRGGIHYLASDDQEVANKYGLRLIKKDYR